MFAQVRQRSICTGTGAGLPGLAGFARFEQRQRMQQMGLRREDVVGRPIVAIVNTWSDLSPCHAHLRERAEAVKRGVLLAGGMPFELPAMEFFLTFWPICSIFYCIFIFKD